MFVLKGFEGPKAFRTDSPMCMRSSVRLLLAVNASLNWTVNSIDFKTAFLQGDPIEWEIYMRPPNQAQTDKIWKLNKTVLRLQPGRRCRWGWWACRLESMGSLESVKSRESLESLELELWSPWSHRSPWKPCSWWGPWIIEVRGGLGVPGILRTCRCLSLTPFVPVIDIWECT